MKVSTSRFGNLEVNKKDIITFKDGLLGFEHLKNFFVVDPGDQTLILWLQSIEKKDTAFPIIEPKIFKPDYTVKLLPPELASLDIENLSNTSVYAILTIPKTVTDMSANLKAPIIVNNSSKIARQIVLQDCKLEVRYQMYMELKKYIVNYASDDARRTHITIPSAQETLDKAGALNSSMERTVESNTISESKKLKNDINI